MPKKKEEIKFVVVRHHNGSKTLKDLLKNLIIRDISETSKKTACSKQRKNNGTVEKSGIARYNKYNKQSFINAVLRCWKGAEMDCKQRAALYSRLSRDDGIGESESNSISNQKQMLSRYAKEHSFSIVDHYVDDGWTGTSFNKV